MYGAQMTPVFLFWDKDTRPHPSELNPTDLDRVVFKGSIGGSDFLATLGGYIATEEGVRQSAADYLNSFQLAFSVLRKYPLDPIDPRELDTCAFDPTSGSIHLLTGKIGRLGSAFTDDREHHLRLLRQLQPIAPFCDAKAIATITELADRMAQSGYQVLFSAVLNANAARGNGESIVAFVGFWLLLEMLVAEELTRYMKAEGTQQPIIEASLKCWRLHDRLALLKRWNVSQPLGPGDPTTFARIELKELRNLAVVRNRIMHAAQRPSD